MSDYDANPIPVTILTGFLGAGKTTLLNHILNADHGLRIAVLVNDFGTINIDSQLVVDVDAGDTIELSNGCICCTIRGDLLGALISLIERPEPPEYIIIEASGVSDPLEIALTFKQDQLKPFIIIDAVLTVIDAEQVLDLDRENEVLAVLQVGAADIVIVNKVDLVDHNQLERVKKWVRSVITSARIIEAQHGQIPLPLILSIGAFSPSKLETHALANIHVHDQHTTTHTHHDHSIIFDTWNWSSDEPLSLKQLNRTISRLPADIYRIKGFVFLTHESDHGFVLQVAGKRATITPLPTNTTGNRHSQIVLIGRHGTLNTGILSQHFERCKAPNATKTPLTRLAKGVMTWLRASEDSPKT